MAVPKADGAALLDRLGLERAGDVSHELGAAWCCAETPEGWLVIAASDRSVGLDEILSGAEGAGEVLAFEMSETVMVSRAVGLTGGRRWAVTHDPDEDLDGVAVEGDPPAQFPEILRRLQAQQAAGDESVDYVFDVPLDLSMALCGYRPGESPQLEWTALQPAGARSSSGQADPGSLLGAMRAELVPLLRSLGWDVQGDRPRLSGPGDISRRVDGVKQLIWFDYAQGEEIYIAIQFATVDESGPDERFSMTGRVAAPARPPWWKRFSWKGLRAAPPDAPPPPSDIPSVLEQASREILIADAFLRTGETGGRIQAHHYRLPAT